MSEGPEQLGLGFNPEQEDNLSMEINSSVEKGLFSREDVIAALDRLKNYKTDPEQAGQVGQLVAEHANIKTGYTFHTYREPTSEDILDGKSPRKLIRQDFSLEDQYALQGILKTIDVEAELATRSEVQELGSIDRGSDEDDDVLYIREDGTKVYRQDRYDRERGTY